MLWICTFAEWSSIPCRIAGIIPRETLNLEDEFTSVALREKSKPILFALAAARRAVKDSMLKLSSPNYNSYGTYLFTYLCEIVIYFELVL